MIFEALYGIKCLIYNTLVNSIKFKKPQRDFFIEIMFLFLTVVH